MYRASSPPRLGIRKISGIHTYYIYHTNTKKQRFFLPKRPYHHDEGSAWGENLLSKLKAVIFLSCMCLNKFSFFRTNGAKLFFNFGSHFMAWETIELHCPSIMTRSARNLPWQAGSYLFSNITTKFEMNWGEPNKKVLANCHIMGEIICKSIAKISH